jgi:hypothetical protein
VKLLLLLFLFSFSTFAEINMETHDFSFEYGLSYHTVRGEQKSNGSKGRLVTNQMPSFMGSYTYRFSNNMALKFFGGIQVVKFDEPAFGTLINEDQVLNQFGMEIIAKTSPFAKWGFFVRQQDHPLYFAKTPTDFEILKLKFVETGVHYSLGQRRRIGLIWNLGGKAFHVYPAKGGNVATESGIGGEGYARLGWIGPWGTVFTMKGFYQITTAPNADVNFSHENLGYAFVLNYTY